METNMYFKLLNSASLDEKGQFFKLTIFFLLSEIAVRASHLFKFFNQQFQWAVLKSLKYILVSMAFIMGTQSLAVAASALDLKVNPPVSYLSVKPGAGINHQIKLKNDGLYTLEVTPALVDFHGDDVTGRVVLEQKSDFTYLNLDGDAGKWGKSFLLKPGDEQLLNFVIALPSEAVYAEEHLSILFQAKQLSYNSASSQDTLISAVVVSNVVLLISPDEQNRGELVIEQFFLPKIVDSFFGFNFSASVKNIGGNAIPVEGYFKISHWPDQNVELYQLYPDMVLAGGKRLVRAMSETDLQELEKMEEAKEVQIAAGNDYEAVKNKFINEKLKSKLLYKKSFLVGAYDLELKIGDDILQKRVIALPFSLLLFVIAVPFLYWISMLLKRHL